MSEIPNPISISGSSLVMFSVVAFALEEMILGWFRRRANQTLWKAHYIFAFIYISMWSGVSASDDCMFKFGVALIHQPVPTWTVWLLFSNWMSKCMLVLEKIFVIFWTILRLILEKISKNHSILHEFHAFWRKFTFFFYHSFIEI